MLANHLQEDWGSYASGDNIGRQLPVFSRAARLRFYAWKDLMKRWTWRNSQCQAEGQEQAPVRSKMRRHFWRRFIPARPHPLCFGFSGARESWSQRCFENERAFWSWLMTFVYFQIRNWERSQIFGLDHRHFQLQAIFSCGTFVRSIANTERNNATKCGPTENLFKASRWDVQDSVVTLPKKYRKTSLGGCFWRDTQSDFHFWCGAFSFWLGSILSSRCRGASVRGASALVCVRVHLPLISNIVLHIYFALSVSWLVRSLFFLPTVCLWSKPIQFVAQLHFFHNWLLFNSSICFFGRLITLYNLCLFGPLFFFDLLSSSFGFFCMKMNRQFWHPFPCGISRRQRLSKLVHGSAHYFFTSVVLKYSILVFQASALMVYLTLTLLSDLLVLAHIILHEWSVLTSVPLSEPVGQLVY